MMNSHKHAARTRAAVAVALFAGLLIAGCTRPPVGVRIESFKDPYFPETYHVALEQCAYQRGPAGELRVVGKRMEQTAAGPTRQYLFLNVAWTPRPGKTPADATTNDAVVRYVVATDRGVVAYAGTGFVYPQSQRNGDLLVKLEGARLHLVRDDGTPGDLFGSCRLTGILAARLDAAQAAHLVREMDIAVGPP